MFSFWKNLRLVNGACYISVLINTKVKQKSKIECIAKEEWKKRNRARKKRKKKKKKSGCVNIEATNDWSISSLGMWQPSAWKKHWSSLINTQSRLAHKPVTSRSCHSSCGLYHTLIAKYKTYIMLYIHKRWARPAVYTVTQAAFIEQHN